MTDLMHLTGENCRLLQRFAKPLRSAQGMAVWEDRAFILYEPGMCGVYDLARRAEAPLAFFPLGSYNEGTPTPDHTNHANQCMFGPAHWKDNPIPLLYVTAGKGIGQDEDGFFYRCSVENICRKDETYTAEKIQTVIFKPTGTEGLPYEMPCWGCPSFFVDAPGRALYIFSARFRTTREFLSHYDENAYILTKFPLPSPEDGPLIRLTERDITGQFTAPFDVLFTQGGTIRDGKLYHTFGLPARDYPLALRVYDLEKRCLCARVDLTGSVMGDEEIECCDFWGDTLLCNTCQGGLYAVQEGVFPLR